MIEFLFWLLLLPVTIGIISLYFIVYQFTVNKVEAGLNKLTSILVKIEKYLQYGIRR
jgi:uncharacterized protein YggT (Ycf19 family)